MALHNIASAYADARFRDQCPDRRNEEWSKRYKKNKNMFLKLKTNFLEKLLKQSLRMRDFERKYKESQND